MAMTAVGPSLVKSSSVCLDCKRVCAEDGGSCARKYAVKSNDPSRTCQSPLTLAAFRPWGSSAR